MNNVLRFPASVPDATARGLALDIHGSWIVEAPAGSGKTGLLIQRYLKLLGDESVAEPEQVMAITFTVKATAEMRDRVLRELEAAEHGAPVKDEEFARTTRALATTVLERSTKLQWGLQSQPQRLRIRTIDSLSSEIAGALPLLSGSGGMRERTTTPEALHREAARRTLMLLGSADKSLHDALRRLLRYRDGNLGGCERLIAEMLGWREQWGGLIPMRAEEMTDAALEQNVRHRLERTLEQIACEALRSLVDAFPREVLEDLTAFAAEMSGAAGYNGGDSPIAICAELRKAPGDAAEHLSHWKALAGLLLTKGPVWRAAKGINKRTIGFEMTAAERAKLGALIDELRGQDVLLEALKQMTLLPPILYSAEQWEMVKALFRILRRAMVELRLLFAEREECDFTEITLAAKTALEHEDGAAGYSETMGMNLQHLLVDEMQDTSLGQYKLIELLTRGWDGSSQTLFLVGDPKQSIYLFRQARVERFLRTMEAERLGELPLGALRLTANFRSQQKLVDQFNLDFAKIFAGAGPEYAGDVQYVHAAAVRAMEDVEGVAWHPMEEGESDAAGIREIIAAWRARPLPAGRTEPWKIAVLVRARAHLDAMVRELKHAEIPYRAVKVEALADRQEVLDIFALTRALLHPADRVAWLAILRAPWCGLGRADLLELAGGDDYEWSRRTIADAIVERGERLSEDGCERLARVWPVLQAALAQSGRLTAAQLVERTWCSLGGDAYASADEAANVHYYLQLLDKMEADGLPDLTLLKEMMGKLFATSTASADAVDLMTIHGAKGLEWDVVIVPALEKKTRSSRSPLMEWMELDMEGEDVAQFLLAPIRSAGEKDDQLNLWIRSVRKMRDAAERKRLYYVACTRAKMSLHLFAAAKGIPHPESLLRAAWPAAEQNFAAKELPIDEAPVQEEDEVFAIAAGAGDRPLLPPQIIRRLPLSFDPAMRFREAKRLVAASDFSVAKTERFFDRPEGSFAARTFGNTVHAFLEVLAGRIAAGAAAAELLAELPVWDARVSAVLRAAGVAPGGVKEMAAATLRGLQNTLRDEAGRWVLAAHAAARSEQALELEERTLRLDRSFYAGAEPLSNGESHLWIVDFKTGEPGGRDAEAYFAAEREVYRPQMETYAAAYADEGRPVRLALYYPLASRLVLV